MERSKTQEDEAASTQRKLQYSVLLNDVNDLEESNDRGLNTTKQISTILEKVADLHSQCKPESRVKHIDETILDHKVIRKTTNILIKCTDAIDLESIQYDPDEFCTVLLEKLGCEDVDFSKLFNVASIIPEEIYFHSVYSACDFGTEVVVKEKKVKEKVNKNQKNAPKKELIHVTNQKKDESTDNIAFIYKIIKKVYEKNKRQPLDYYDLVVDSSDFSATVENVFYCSFLVKEGKVNLYKENGVLKIAPKSGSMSVSQNANVSMEWIHSIDMDFWEKFQKEGYLQKYKNRKAHNNGASKS